MADVSAADAPGEGMAVAGGGYRRGRSVVTALHVHLAFVTKYRRGVLSERALSVLRASMTEVCRAFGAELKGF